MLETYRMRTSDGRNDDGIPFTSEVRERRDIVFYARLATHIQRLLSVR